MSPGIYSPQHPGPSSLLTSPIDGTVLPLGQGTFQAQSPLHPPLPPAYTHVDHVVLSPRSQLPENNRNSEPLSGAQHSAAKRSSPVARVSSFVGGYAPSATFKFEQNSFTSAKRRPENHDYWHSDDEASMGESDDEALSDIDDIDLQSSDLGIVESQRLGKTAPKGGTSLEELQAGLRSNSNWLQTYMPSSADSPLNDEETAVVFWYFVNVTGPGISSHERHPFDALSMSRGQPVPRSKQHIWTCRCHVAARHASSFLLTGFRYFPRHCSAPPCAYAGHVSTR